MAMEYQVICEWVERDLIRLKRIDTSINLADIFTKLLGRSLFYRHTNYVLGHIPSHYVTPTPMNFSSPVARLQMILQCLG